MNEIISFLDYVPLEIINLIFDDLNLNDLLHLASTNIWLMNHIRTTKWRNICVRINKNINNVNHIVTTYKFIKYDFSYSQITDESVKLLGNCHTLYLYGCTNITDESVKLLGNCHTLNLYRCTKITDESVKFLRNLGVEIYR